MKLNFVYNWGGNSLDNRLTKWSGTPNGLLTALNKIVEVNDISLKRNLSDHFLAFFWKVYRKLYHTSDFLMEDSSIGDRQFKRLIKKSAIDKGPILGVLEYNHTRIEDYYMYQDFTADFIIRYAREHKEWAKYLPCIIETNNVIANIRKKRTYEIYSHCKGIFTMGEYLKRDLVEHTGIDPKKVHVVYGGCNIDLSKINYNKKNGTRFLFVGKDWERKNGLLVVKAFRKLQKKYSEIELYISGPQKIPKELIDDVNNGKVYYFGLLSYNKLIELYNLCDYFVLPSLVEAYGIAFGEALIFGLPCIGRNDFAMPEFIVEGKSGYLLFNNDEDQLTGLMEKCLINSRYLKEYVVSNKEYYIHKYSWEAVAEKIIDVMRKDGYDI